jgi:phosphatidylglycerophosphate synthase
VAYTKGESLVNIQEVLSEYQLCLKPIYIEDGLDLMIYRPIAFILIKIISVFPVNPNQITLLGVVTGILSAYFFSLGTRRAFTYAGILYFAMIVLDNSDGMLARSLGKGTAIGRLVDGFSDYFTTIIVFVGLGIGLSKSSLYLPISPWLLLILAAVSTGFQLITVDFYKNNFMARALGKGRSIHEEISEFEKESHRLKGTKGHFIEEALIRIYLGYSKIQAQAHGKRELKATDNEYEYFIRNRIPVRLWTLIGLDMLRTALVVSALLYKPMIFFYYVLLFANFWMLSLLLWQYVFSKSPVVQEY